MREAIIGDIHSRRDKLHECLLKIGAIENGPGFTRVEGWRLIHTGDMLNLEHGYKEADFYREVCDLFDECLIGNHELPSVHPDPAAVSFRGWEGRDLDAEKLVAEKHARGGYMVATSVGDWLVTHAGLSAMFFDEWWNGDAKRVAGRLNQAWEFRADCMKPGSPFPVQGIPVFDHVGWVRGGPHVSGSIFWHDVDELKKEYHVDKSGVFPKQIVGHSGHSGPIEHIKNQLWCIDTPRPRGQDRSWGGVAALVTEDNGESFALTYVE